MASQAYARAGARAQDYGFGCSRPFGCGRAARSRSGLGSSSPRSTSSASCSSWTLHRLGAGDLRLRRPRDLRARALRRGHGTPLCRV